MGKVKEKIKDFDNFPWQMIDIEVDCSLRTVIQLYVNTDK